MASARAQIVSLSWHARTDTCARAHGRTRARTHARTDACALRRMRAQTYARTRTEGLTTARATGGQEWQSFATVRRKVADVAMLRDAIEWVLRAAGALQSLTMMAALL